MFRPAESARAIERLLSWNQLGDEDDKWAEKAVYFLVKKLKKQKGALEELERALAQNDAQTRCITIPRNLDGRMQVSHKKDLPHVVYCRMWRWPDLQYHRELKPLDHCEFAFTHNKADVCINPYHYIRKEAVVLAPVLVPRNPQQLVPSRYIYEPVPSYLIDSEKDSVSPGHYDHPLELSETQPPAHSEPTGSSSIPIEQSTVSDSDQCPESFLSPHPTDTRVAISSCSSSTGIPSPSLNVVADSGPVPINYQKPPFWCSVAYYELNNRLGELFKATSNDVVVDGFSDPCTTGDRFCLGLVSSTYRNKTIEDNRRQIGRGVHLAYWPWSGEVFAENYSKNSMFVQSRNCNASNLFHPLTVCKIPSGCSMKIFDNQAFATMLAQSVDAGFEAVYELTKMCSVSLSLTKGWGAEYQRQDVTSTPCWIEIHLHGPLMWLDKVMIHMGRPGGAVNSDT